MKSLSRLFIAAVLVMPATAFAQSRDIAGTWVFDAAKSGTPSGPPSISITLTAKDVTIALGPKAEQAITFPLDGTETTLPKGLRGKAAWRKDTLEVTTTATSKPAQNLTFSRSDQWLVMGGTTPEGPKTLFFLKAPPKL